MTKLSQTLKFVVKKPADKVTFGTDPKDPWSAKAGINEGALEQYLKSKGINPEYVSKDQKIAYAKSMTFLKWKAEHQFEEVIPESMVIAPSITHKKKAETQKSAHAHKEIKTPRGPGSHNEGKGSQMTQLTPESVSQEIHGEAKKPKLTALDKFRKSSAERQKKHDEIEKKSGGMTSAIDRLQKHMNKEEVEQIDELNYDTVKSLYTKRRTIRDLPSKKSKDVKVKNVSTSISRLAGHKPTQNQPFDKVDKGTHFELVPKNEEVEELDELKKDTLKSYRDKSMASLKNARKNRDAAEPGKDMSKGFADLHAKSDAIAKKRAKGLSGYLQRKHGMKPGYPDERKTTSEDVGDPKAAVNADGQPNPQLEPVSEKKKQMSKSARMIKALYKKKGVVKEDMHDHEKEDKSVAAYGKKPKVDKADKDDSKGENKPQAAMTLTGGKTLTGIERDTVEIDPMMRNRPGQPDVTKKDDKKDGKKEDKKKDK